MSCTLPSGLKVYRIQPHLSSRSNYKQQFQFECPLQQKNRHSSHGVIIDTLRITVIINPIILALPISILMLISVLLSPPETPSYENRSNPAVDDKRNIQNDALCFLAQLNRTQTIFFQISILSPLSFVLCWGCSEITAQVILASNLHICRGLVPALTFPYKNKISVS